MNLKKSFKLSSLALATSLAMGTAMMPSTASAEMSADLTISSMYLWRGLDVSANNPAVSSTIAYDFGNGFSVGTWASSEGASGSYEVDLFASYEGSVGDFGYSIGYATYMYPQVPVDLGDSDISEYILGLSYGDFGFTAYINAEPDDFADYEYYSFDYSMGKIGLHYGMTSSSDPASEYNDYNVSFALTDALSWTVSKASGDYIDADPALKDPLVMISYSVPLK